MVRKLSLAYVFFALFLLAGCGSSGGGIDSSNAPGSLAAYNLVPNGTGSHGGPTNPGPGTGAPNPFVPGGDPTPGPTPTPIPPVPTQGLYVRAGASGIGTSTDPRGDLVGALEQAQSGQTVTILYSADPLVFNGRPVIPDGVSLVGQAGSDGTLPTVTGVFSVGNDVTVSGFHSTAGGQRFNFDLSGSHDVTFSEMHIVNGAQKMLFNNVSGEIRLQNSTVEGGGPGGGSLSGLIETGNANFMISNCDLLGATFYIAASGADTLVNVLYTNNRSSGSVTVNSSSGARVVSRVEDNIFTAEFGSNGVSSDHNDGGSGDLICLRNTMTATGSIWLRKFGSGGGGTVTILDNLWQDFAGLPYYFNFESGAYDVTVVNNQLLGNSATNQLTDMQLNARGSSRVRARIEDNTFSYGLYVSAGETAVADVGILNNIVGQNPSTAGAGRRTLNVTGAFGFTGVLSTVVTGNSVGTAAVPAPLTVSQVAGTVGLERISTLATDNTLFGTATATTSGDVVGIPEGTVDMPAKP